MHDGRDLLQNLGCIQEDNSKVGLEIGCEYASCMRYSAYSLVHRNNCSTEESCTACF